MTDMLIGAAATAAFLMLVNYARRRRLQLGWWKWVLTVLAFLYGIFVLEVISSFFAEGASQAALVMGVVLGIIAVIWGVLLGRFVFARAPRKISLYRKS